MAAFDPLSYKVPGEYQYEGITFSIAFPDISYDMLDGWQVKESDVVVTTFPKSGTWWISEIVAQVLDQRGGPSVPYIEMGFPGVPTGIKTLDTMKDPRLLKSHLSYKFFERKVEIDNLKVVVVLRDPRDVLVSYYHMYQSEQLGGFPGSFSDFFQLVKAKKLLCGCPLDWAASWWQKKDLPNVLLVTYEDMKADCGQVVRSIASFLGRSLSDKRVDAIVEHCSFGEMKKRKPIFVPDGFYRKGLVGDWNNHFSVEEAKYAKELIRQKFGPVGLRLYE
ncbi:hypothetical protein CAPTEDRAFT_220895 [Capitella teleta]|uniref:Sulfotransferase domain-containing protein n=1 Tax=Capitella teleta TaxID=283909 RepID=R7VF01_CAPTE|nr:hypothetical protein CAPTEDRAFT_220895 [Capitella teleta]|eukprot:ELU14240.1 hypothetical protein CAPTEDRAFT_220895 [Capitella teleta]